MGTPVKTELPCDFCLKTTNRCPPRKPWRHILWSGLGAFLGILAVAALGHGANCLSVELLFLIGSFGASAVLVYGAPRAEFSQPRNLVGGHVVSACVGVMVCMLLDAYPIGAGALAVSLAIMAMHITRTLHPPGGATALIAVIGGPRVQALGFVYVLCPVLVGTLIMLALAWLINNRSRDDERRYPVYWW